MEKSTHSAGYAALRSELRDARESAGLSQRDLALKLDVPHSWIAKVESGERRIDVVEFCWLMTACDADPITAFAKLLPSIHKRRPGRAAKGSRGE